MGDQSPSRRSRREIRDRKNRSRPTNLSMTQFRDGNQSASASSDSQNKKKAEKCDAPATKLWPGVDAAYQKAVSWFLNRSPATSQPMNSSHKDYDNFVKTLTAQQAQIADADAQKRVTES